MHQEILIGSFLPTSCWGDLVVGKHVVEGVVELIGTLFDLELLSVDLILNVINSLVKLSDVHLSILKSGLSDFVLVLEGKDLLNELLLSLKGLLGRLFKLLHVLTNSLEFLLNALEVLLSELCSLKTSLKLRLLDSQLSAQLIKLLLIVNSHLDGGSEVLVKLFNGELVIGLIITDLKVLDLLAKISDITISLVSSGSGLSGCIFKRSNGGIELLCLSLQRLHLLSNGIHFCCLS